MLRLTKMFLLSLLFAWLSAFIWLLWAQDEYRGQTGCPWDMAHNGHPVVIGLGLTLGSMLIVTGVWRVQGTRGEAVAIGLFTGLVAAIVTYVVALWFGAGLQCFD